MSLLKVRCAARITLPAEVQEARGVREGDYLEAELVEGGVMPRPVPIVRSEQAWQEVRAAIASVRPTPEQAAKPLVEQEQDILEAVDEARREYADERRRS